MRIILTSPVAPELLYFLNCGRQFHRSACVDAMLICAFAARLCNMLWRGSYIYTHVGFIVYMFCLVRWNVPRVSHPELALADPFVFPSSMIILFTCRGRAVT